MKYFIFDNIKYSRPRNNNYGRPITEIIGLDSETLISGRPFLFCTSRGDAFTLRDIPHIFFARKYRGVHFGVYNLKFDSGSILYSLPSQVLQTLRVEGKADYRGYTYSYIPHKRLRISKGKNGVTFWNIAQFFNMSLDNAAKKYLGESKLSIATKKFTWPYIRKHRAKIVKYCIRDAVLVSKLYAYMLDGLDALNIVPTALYSTASLSYQYFRRNCKIVDVWDIWKTRRGCLKLACESYSGGKFEVYKRGIFEGVSYDINSAYPYEISKLYALDKCKIVFSKEYHSSAEYGYIRVFIDNSKGYYLPCSVKYGLLNVYPAGQYYTTITKTELEYLYELNIPVVILSAFWIYTKDSVRPYDKIIADLYSMKLRYKDRDARLYRLAKIMQNSFYGKMAQLIPRADGSILAGSCWNPVHASVVTANVRIKICRICNDNHGKILAVHTDSVVSTRPLSGISLGTGLGDWDKISDGRGVIVSCGIYQIQDHIASRGFMLEPGRDLFYYLRKMGRASTVSIKQLSVKSWVECNIRKRPSLTNRFIYERKILDVNAEKKRLWSGLTNGRKLLSSLENSAPKILIQDFKP